MNSNINPSQHSLVQNNKQALQLWAINPTGPTWQWLWQQIDLLAADFKVEIVDAEPSVGSYLRWDTELGLSFIDRQNMASQANEDRKNPIKKIERPMILHLDFIADKQNYNRYSHRGKSELIAKAAGLSKGYKHILDLTLGLAQDAWFLSELGAEVVGIERSPVVYLLVAEAYQRARLHDNRQLSIYYDNSLELLKKATEDKNFWFDFVTQKFSQQADPQSVVLYLDPMFPEKTKAALPRKEMQIFRHWVGGDEDASQLLQLAMTLPVDRIVVKRPLRAPPLHERVVHSFEGKTVRYDLYGGKK